MRTNESHITEFRLSWCFVVDVRSLDRVNVSSVVSYVLPPPSGPQYIGLEEEWRRWPLEEPFWWNALSTAPPRFGCQVCPSFLGSLGPHRVYIHEHSLSTHFNPEDGGSAYLRNACNTTYFHMLQRTKRKFGDVIVLYNITVTETANMSADWSPEKSSWSVIFAEPFSLNGQPNKNYKWI
jgi:hypothetical protein